MTLNMPSRRLLRSASALASSATTPNALLPALQSLSLAGGSSPCTSARSLHTTAHRAWFFGKKNKTDSSASPLDKQLTGTADTRQKLINSLQSRLQGPAMFQDEGETTPAAPGAEAKSPVAGQPKPRKDPRAYTAWGASLVKEHLARAADPDPRSRVRWERKMVIRQITRGTDAFSVEPRAEKIARTERVLRSKSSFLPTSIKKLVMLARQVQGKTVDDALVQMRYSKKKMAKEVRVQLERARDLAIAERGMGLGKNAGEKNEVVKIQTKEGKHLKIEDPTRMYVAEAWVGRGPWRGKRVYHHGRGRMSLQMSPSTSISLVLKEEKTRIREHQERVAKKHRQGPWVHLPDRPVTAQRPYYSW